MVDGIHQQGGTILGTSRGPVNPASALETVIRHKLNILFTIGGDGTQRGGWDLFQEARKRGYPLSVVGIPKTIDNDVAFVSRASVTSPQFKRPKKCCAVLTRKLGACKMGLPW